MDEPIIVARGLKKHFPVSRGLLFSRTSGWIKSVDGVDLAIRPGETVGLVGESGCGKTTMAKLLLRLETATEGSVLFHGQEIGTLNGRGLTEYRKSVQAVFQNPFSSLDPRMQVGSIISEPLSTDRTLGRKDVADRVARVLETVGLDPSYARKYPHEFSGGQRQRVAIARALVCNPRLIILDEPVSAQDVSIRAQLLNLLKDLQSQLGISFLFIGHDLATVRYMCHRVFVMYLGKIVELAPADDLCGKPLHPYTRALLAASLPDRPDAPRAKSTLKGEVPSPLNPPDGCRFHTRCPNPGDRCSDDIPSLIEVSPTRSVACMRFDRT